MDIDRQTGKPEGRQLTSTNLIFCWLMIALVNGEISSTYAQSSVPVLRVGDPAPSISMEAWPKGTPVTEFKKEHFYIVEFGSIACGPCRASIPHMTRIAREYADEVSLISVFIYENGYPALDTTSTAYVDRVQNFINKMGKRVGYTVGVDDAKQTMAKKWIEASGQNSIPVAFIIDDAGFISWIGHPFDLEKVIKAIIGNNTPSMETNIDRSLDEVEAYRQKKAYSAAIRKIDSLLQEHPEKAFLYKNKVEILLLADEPLAYTYTRGLLKNELSEIDYMLTEIASHILNTKVHDLMTAMTLVIDLTERASQLSMDELISGSIFALQAQAYFNNGNIKMAISITEKAIATAKQTNFDDGYTLRDLEHQLSKFKAEL